jgi:hypothetical protein
MNTPKAATQARHQLAARLKLSESAISIVSFNKVEWPDAMLGIGDEEMMGAQVIVPGYVVMLEAKGKKYEAHTDLSGDTVRFVKV